ncbi:MAG: hypothetical protein M3010_09730 [Candidatus Dormibacteraeota bacterium]|nr:hypothetical protein [Candidatus Dormibacteraeota bacterium]
MTYPSSKQRSDTAAQERGGDPDQGMTDEATVATSSLQQAHFWRQTYAEILAMERGVMTRIHELMEHSSDAVRQEVEMSNLPVIAAQVERFRQRHEFWSVRVRELENT